MRDIFNLAGIVMPALLLDGQIIGRWKIKNSTLTVELFAPICAQDKAMIEQTAHTLCGESIRIDFSS